MADYTAKLDQGGVKHVEIVSDPVQVPLGATHCDVLAQNDGWPEPKDAEGKQQLVVKLRAELSLDGGLTFSPKPSGERVWPFGIFPLGCTRVGGPVPLGKPNTVGVINIPLPEPNNPNRMIRTTLIPLRGTITTGVSAKFTVQQAAETEAG